MRYVLFLAGPGFVSVASFATYKAAVAKVSYRACAADAVVLRTRRGRVVMTMS